MLATKLETTQPIVTQSSPQHVLGERSILPIFTRIRLETHVVWAEVGMFVGRHEANILSFLWP